MTRVAINGFGRIGRNFLRAYLECEPSFEVVAINDLGDPKTMAHLLQFDSVLGRLPEEVTVDSETLTVGERRLQAFSIPEPERLPWRELGVDVVIESTGRFTKRGEAQAHLDAGARTVMISAVANEADVTLVMGVNDERSAPGARRDDQPDPDHDRRHARARSRVPKLEGKISALAIRGPSRSVRSSIWSSSSPHPPTAMR